MIVGLLVGSFAPTPLFPVYFFEPVPFVVLFVAYGLADSRKSVYQTTVSSWRLIGGIALLAVFVSIPSLFRMSNPFDRGTWIPLRVHQAGQELAAAVGPGRVLTYSPIFPLEGGQDIYEELATGPFSARAARLISELDEARFKVADEDDWKHALRRRPAAALLTGFEGHLDDDLVAQLPPKRLHHASIWFQGKELHVFKWLPKRSHLQEVRNPSESTAASLP